AHLAVGVDERSNAAGHDVPVSVSYVGSLGAAGGVRPTAFDHADHRRPKRNRSPHGKGLACTASCVGAPSGAGGWSSSGWRWPAPFSSVAGGSAAPGPATAGRAAPAAAHDTYSRGL